MGDDLTITDKINIFLIPVLVALGFILNTLTIMVFCRRKMRKYCLSISMIYLALSDTLVLVGPVLFTWIDENFFGSYIVNNTVWCNLHGYADLILSANSSWTIILISSERWFAVWRPWQKAKQFTNKRMKLTILGLFVLSTGLFAYFPLSLRVTKIENSTAEASSLNETYYAAWPHHSECKIYRGEIYSFMGSVSVLLVYVVPFFLLAILNIMIIIKLQQRPFHSKVVKSKTIARKASTAFQAMNVIGTSMLQTNETITMNQVTANNATSNSGPSSGGDSDQKQPRNGSSALEAIVSHLTSLPPSDQLPKTSIQLVNSSKNDQNLSITLVTVAVTFMVLTFPFQAYWFYEQFLDISRTEHTLTELNLRNLTFIFKNTNYLINFFLYSALSKLFRAEFLALVVDDKFFFIGSCIKCLFLSKKDISENKKRRNKDFANSSSFAEISFSMDALKKLKSGDFASARYFGVKIEPSNFMTYFRRLGQARANSKKHCAFRSHQKKMAVLRNNQQVYGDHVMSDDGTAMLRNEGQLDEPCPFSFENETSNKIVSSNNLNLTITYVDVGVASRLESNFSRRSEDRSLTTQVAIRKQKSANNVRHKSDHDLQTVIREYRPKKHSSLKHFK
jgi:hypothetical protein